MKKLTIGLAVLLSGVAANSFAAVAAGASPYSVCVPSLCGGFNVGITGYWWRASLPHSDYALTYPTFTPAVAIAPALIGDPFGPFDVVFTDGRYHSTDHKHRWGYRINVGYVFPCSGNDVTLAYTHWDHDDDDHVNRNSGVILPTLTADTLGGTILFPCDLFVFDDVLITPVSLCEIFAAYDGVVDLADAFGGVPVDRASAHSDIKYHAWDLEFGQYVSVGCNTRMRWFAGVRWANIDHRFTADYSGALGPVDITAAEFPAGTPLFPAAEVDLATLSMAASINIHHKSDFEGVGPRFGLNTSYGFGCSGFGIVGEASAALLVGEIDSHFREADVFSATLALTPAGLLTPVLETGVVTTTETFHHPDETRIVPNLEAKLGVDYSYVFCNCSRSKLTLEVGYMVTHYFNSNDVLSDVGVDAPEFRTRHTIDTSFDGPYATLTFQM